METKEKNPVLAEELGLSREQFEGTNKKIKDAIIEHLKAKKDLDDVRVIRIIENELPTITTPDLHLAVSVAFKIGSMMGEAYGMQRMVGGFLSKVI